MNRTYVSYPATPASIEKQTEKAILVNGFGWMPKSQVKFVEGEGGCFMVIPKWLWNKNNYSYYNVYGTKVAQLADESDLQNTKDITAEVYN